jgi:DNA-directed RNA polymerase subunit delta
MQNKTYPMSEVDLAHKMLHDAGRAMYFRDLIGKVLEAKGDPVHSPAHAIAEIHTQINMDSRFMHVGKGMWGLAEWMPQRGNRYMEDSSGVPADPKLRRERLLEEIQQDYVAATVEPDEIEEPS